VRYLVGAACLVLVAAGCGGGGKSAATTTAATTTTTGIRIPITGKYHYSGQVVNSFMRSCTKGDPAKFNYCACVIDKLSQSVSTRDFARIARTGRAVPRVARAIRRATAACAGTG
jgi:hypothetical protein